ncbi:glutathione S-transferase family protein [Neisseriaceae bacterium CLB008]|nr:glutathione S-transferase family protein [Neisseriaceae bacterium]
MSLIVYGAPLSPFVRKVLWFVQEREMDFEHKVIMPFVQQPDWYLEISPLGKIPAIQDGDFGLADSAVICGYLHDQYPQGLSLYPSTPQALAQVRWLERYADETLAQAATFSLFSQRVLSPMMGKPVDEALVDAALAKLPQLFDYLTKVLGTQDYLVDNTLSVADLAVATQWVSLGYAGETIDAERWPALAAHFKRLSERPVLQAMLAKEQALMAKLMAKSASA